MRYLHNHNGRRSADATIVVYENSALCATIGCMKNAVYETCNVSGEANQILLRSLDMQYMILKGLRKARSQDKNSLLSSRCDNQNGCDPF